VYGTGAAVGGGLGGGLSQGSNSTAAIAGGAAGGFVGGAVLGAILANYVCPAKEEPPPPTPPPPPPTRQKIETLEGPNFDFDKAVLLPDGRVKVDRVVTLMLNDPSMRVAVEGHTDAIGTDAYNQGLSERRANAVRNHMIAQGLSPDRITTRGLGETQPLASNDTEEGRAQNRRVDIFAE
jgi:OOP family OmpA-OmpF porin